jgi:hypothetical protein
MVRRYLAFDIETAKEVPGEDFNWRPHRPLGISCAATLDGDGGEPVRWHSRTTGGTPDKRMRKEDVQELVRYLCRRAAEGCTILTWNGLGFDFDVLAEESAAPDVCRECALGHVDMMFHVFCTLGYPVGLDRAAQGLGLPGKPAGMTGLKAPALWAEGHFEEVLDYVAQDVRTAMQIARTCEKARRFQWVTRKGRTNSMPLNFGWLTVREALQLPEPDTSWMSTPLSRGDFVGWLSAT